MEKSQLLAGQATSMQQKEFSAAKGRLFNISPLDCQKVYPKVFANADRTFLAAELLKTNGFYGQAIPVATASLEEYIKAIILQLDGLGFEFRNTKGISRFFTEHTIRHVMAGILLGVYALGKDIVDALQKAFSDPVQFALFVLRMSNLERFTEDLQGYIRAKATEMKTELPFFLRMEDSRQLGFYCEYPDGLHTPDGVSASECTETFEKVEKIRTVIIQFSQAMAQKDQQQQIGEMIAILKENHFYQQLSEQLSGVKSDALFERFKSFLDRTENFSI